MTAAAETGKVDLSLTKAFPVWYDGDRNNITTTVFAFYYFREICI